MLGQPKDSARCGIMRKNFSALLPFAIGLLTFRPELIKIISFVSDPWNSLTHGVPA
jgi:hypothetical protein